MVNHPRFESSVSPSHIVVFKRLTDDNLSAITEPLGLEPHLDLGRPGVVRLAPPTGTQEKMLYFPNLGIATLTLKDVEADVLKRDGRVLAVNPNRRVRVDLPARVTPPWQFRWRRIRDGWLRFLGGKPLSEPLEQIGITPESSLQSKGVKIAVLDTGIDLLHPDFAGRFTVGVDAVSFVSGLDVQDGHGHGTHCAGIIAGGATTGGDVRFGVAPEVDLLVGRVLNDGATGVVSDVIEGINWAAEQGARIISMSFGEDRAVGESYHEEYEETATKLRLNGKDVLLIAAAGNGSNRDVPIEAPVEDPAAAPSVMAVAAVNGDNAITKFSCKELDQYGKVDISAPGESIYSSWTGATYWTISGTSMATAHVSGVAALYLNTYPGSTADQLWNLLVSNVDPLYSASDYGAGLVKVPS